MDCWTLAAGQAPDPARCAGCMRHSFGRVPERLARPANLASGSHPGQDYRQMRRCGEKASVCEAANIGEWRGHDVADPGDHKLGKLEASTSTRTLTCPRSAPSRSECRPGTGSCSCLLPRRPWVRVPQGRLRQKQVNDAPLIGTDSELPAAGEEAIFKHYGLTYQPGASGERRLARR